MQTVAIAGVGLIGGSLGLALRRAGFAGSILGVSRPDTIEVATQLGAIDRGVSLEEAATDADVLVLAQPVATIISTLHRLVPLARTDCLITDAGSTKAGIMNAASGVPLFVGGHPMAGKESRGVAAAEAGLFEGRPWVLTRRDSDKNEHPLSLEYTRWLRRCGAVPVFMDAEEHDRVVSLTSHLPQLASTALAAALAGQPLPDSAVRISGSGLRDMTRLSLSSWEVWADIIDSNRENICHALDVYIDRLTVLRDNIDTRGLAEDFRQAAELARRIRQGGYNFDVEKQG